MYVIDQDELFQVGLADESRDVDQAFGSYAKDVFSLFRQDEIATQRIASGISTRSKESMKTACTEPPC